MAEICKKISEIMWKGPHPHSLTCFTQENNSLNSTCVSLKLVGFYPLIRSHSLAFSTRSNSYLILIKLIKPILKFQQQFAKIIPRRFEFQKQECNEHVRSGSGSRNYWNFEQKKIFTLWVKNNFGLSKTLIMGDEQKILSRVCGLFFFWYSYYPLVSFFSYFFIFFFLFKSFLFLFEYNSI